MTVITTDEEVQPCNHVCCQTPAQSRWAGDFESHPVVVSLPDTARAAGLQSAGVGAVNGARDLGLQSSPGWSSTIPGWALSTHRPTGLVSVSLALLFQSFNSRGVSGWMVGCVGGMMGGWVWWRYVWSTWWSRHFLFYAALLNMLGRRQEFTTLESACVSLGFKELHIDSTGIASCISAPTQCRIQRQSLEFCSGLWSCQCTERLSLSAFLQEMIL